MSDSENTSKYNDLSPNEQLVGLLLRHHRRIYGFILALVPNLSDADDLMQETAFVMCRRFHEFQAGLQFYRLGHYDCPQPDHQLP